MNETSTKRRGAPLHRTDGGRPGFGDRPLLVVSNRQPYRHADAGADGVTVDRPTGGLTAGLDPVVQATGGTWIAWGDGDADRTVVDENDCVGVPPEDASYTLRRVWLDDDQVENYYYGFSNRVLWPLCHGTLGTVSADTDYWTAYRETNRQFADVVAAEATPETTVWFQDYHLALAPAMTRRAMAEAPTLMQFWHIPWPGWDTFRACPHRAELLGGLLANDVFGVHVERYRDNFLACVEACLSDAAVDYERGTVTWRGSRTRVVATPMGVPVDDITRRATDEDADAVATLQENYGLDPDRAIGVGVDRLDYTKGIEARLRALEELWATHPEWRESLTYVQNASESRSHIDAYARTQSAVREAVDRVNERFGTDDWQPVVCFTDALSQELLYDLYRQADLGIVSPVRDGLNLVALEYVAAQVESDGVLLLSDQSGAHDLLGDMAYTVSPFDPTGFAEQLDAALGAPAAERAARMSQLRQQVAEVDLASWLERYADLAARVRQQQRRPSRHDAT